MAWSESPSVEALAKDFDQETKTKFHDLPAILHDWMRPAGGLKGKRVLDFGCGFGTTAAGIAELLAPETVIGVDINDEAKDCEILFREKLGRTGLPANLKFEEIRPGQAIGYSDFDCIFSWSVFEHVDNRIFADVLGDLVGRLRHGGHFFVQIAPLYHSPEGSHLWAIGYRNWEHLTSQYSGIEGDLWGATDLTTEQKASLWAMFRTLNRITAPDLLDRFRAAGLTLVRLQQDKTELAPPPALLGAYNADALSTFQIAALFRKD